MNNKALNFLKILSYAVFSIWVLLGVLTFLSIYYGMTGFVINIVMGCVFILIGLYLFLKAKNILALFYSFNRFTINKNTNIINTQFKKMIFFENIFILLSLLIGLIFLTAIFSRVFSEKLPVFGWIFFTRTVSK